VPECIPELSSFLSETRHCLLVAILWLALHSTGLSQTITVDPTAGMKFSPPLEKNVLVQYATPAGWHRWNEGGGFSPNRDKDYPVIVLRSRSKTRAMQSCARRSILRASSLWLP